ncbi:MAG TPA: sugar ABC transporter permease [Clostridiales bacterium]|nr:sugar ABC transporter permease [Clostridiales bacterium]
MQKPAKLKRRPHLSVLYLMMLPGLIYFFINNYLPMFGILIAFKKIDFRKGILGSDWTGLSNFTYLFKTSDAWIITRNTLFYNVAFIILGIIIQVAFAIFLNEIRNKLLLRTFQSLIILPALISMVIVAYLSYAALSMNSGFLNKAILPFLGLPEVSWYSEPRYWPFILTFVNIWKNAGFGCIIYLATVVGISPEYFEAARLDGASRWKQIRHITLPLLKPVIIMLTILNIGKIFYSDFGLFYQVPMNSGVLFNVTNTIDTYVYRGLMQLGDIGRSSAANFYQSIVGFVLVLLSNWFVRKLNPESALF